MTLFILALVADNGRLGKIDSIFKTFEKLMSAHRGEVICEVVTAKVNTSIQPFSTFIYFFLGFSPSTKRH